MANHKGNASGWRFSAINQEQPHGTVVHDHPDLQMDDSVSALWDTAHISYSNQYAPAGDKAAAITVIAPKVSGGYSGNNGCLSIKSGATSKSVGLVDPIVLGPDGKTPLQMWVRTTWGPAPANVTPDTHWVYLKQNQIEV